MRRARSTSLSHSGREGKGAGTARAARRARGRLAKGARYLDGHVRCETTGTLSAGDARIELRPEL